MAHYTVSVQWATGEPATGQRVSLEVEGGFLDEIYTDNYGRASFDTSCRGEARVYVDGQDCGRMHPGNHVVTIS